MLSEAPDLSLTSNAASGCEMQADVPEYVQVEITSRCNLECVMCPLTLGATQSAKAGVDIGEREWEEVAKLARKAGRILMVGFGEPILNKRFVSMLRQMDDAGVSISFSTNGIGAESIVNSLAALNHLTLVNISIDSPDPETYRSIRGGDVHRALKGARALAARLGDRVPVSVCAVVTKKNVRSLLGFPPVLREMGIRLFSLQGIHDYTKEMEDEHIYSNRRLMMFRPKLRLHVVLDELEAECKRHGVELLLSERVASEFYEPWNAAKTYFAPCSTGSSQTRACTVPWTSPYVDAEGRVFPCCQAAGSEPLGLLSEAPLEQIWTGAKFEKFRRDLLSPETTPSICRECTAAPLGEHPFVRYAARIESIESDGERYLMRVRNTGTGRWDQANPLSLGTSTPRDRASVYRTNEWLNDGRLCSMREQSVGPGEIATLSFHLSRREPAVAENFQLLIEGKHWLPGTLFRAPVPAPDVG